MKSQLAIWKQLFVIAVLGAIGYGVWLQRDNVTRLTGISFGQETQERARRGGRGDNKIPVIVEPVTTAKAVDRIEAIGDGVANRSVTIYPEVSGIVAEIPLKAGQRVKAGDVLLKLDDAQAKIAVELARTKLADARRTVERYTALLTRNAVAEVTTDTARTALQTAELELQQAQESLAERTILAPFDGVLGIPQVDVGDRVSETTAIASLDDRSTVIVAFTVPEIYLGRLEVGQKITATNAGLRGQEFEGEITEINSRVDVATRSIRVRALLSNAADALRGGMSFQVVLTLDGAEYPSIGELALLWERDGAYVWRIAQGKAERVNVALVKRDGGRILVDGELAAGQLVVVEGTQRLREGREVSFEEPVSAADEKRAAAL
jgi:RND family efflux transporter MFP subunit